MERGLFLKRFICEHQVVPNLDRDLLKNLHKTLRQEVNILYTFGNLTEKCMYTVIDSHDRLTVESFFSDMRIPWDRIVEVDLQGEGRDKLEDLTLRWAA